MRISQLADRSGVPATTLRFYESAGLLPASRSSSNYRLYGEDSLGRLAFIGAAKHLGLSLEEIAELLAVWESGACSDVKADIRPRILERLSDAERRTAELAAFTASLHTALAELDALPDRPGPCGPDCGYFTPRPPAPAPAQVQAMNAAPPVGEARAEVDRRQAVPVACSLSAAGADERAGQWRELVDGAQCEEIPDGLRLSMPAETAGDVAALAAAEQRCCPFFDFRLHFDGSMLHLEVRAPADGAGLLAELFTPAR